ncbi:MAG: hypothetical protein ACMG6E_04345 [Candidatus Roizmanbacteria bacterium]
MGDCLLYFDGVVLFLDNVDQAVFILLEVNVVGCLLFIIPRNIIRFNLLLYFYLELLLPVVLLGMFLILCHELLLLVEVVILFVLVFKTIEVDVVEHLLLLAFPLIDSIVVTFIFLLSLVGVLGEGVVESELVLIDAILCDHSIVLRDNNVILIHQVDIIRGAAIIGLAILIPLLQLLLQLSH